MPRSRFFFDSATDLLGAHLSTRGGLHTAFQRAAAVGVDAMAVFSKNSNQWNARALSDEDCRLFRRAHADSRIEPLLVHASYLINLATTSELFHQKSLAAMVDELQRAERLGAYAVVLHPGAHMGAGEDHGIDQVARSIDQVHASVPGNRVVTLLETAAGQGSCLGSSFEQLGAILRSVDDPSRIGICIDTCHIFAAGYDIRTRDGYERTIDELERHVGIANVGAFHLNDSKRELGCRIDRHQHIGEGFLGLDPFSLLLNDRRFAGIPKVLETPKPEPLESDIRNLSLLRSLLRPSQHSSVRALRHKVG